MNQQAPRRRMTPHWLWLTVPTAFVLTLVGLSLMAFLGCGVYGCGRGEFSTDYLPGIITIGLILVGVWAGALVPVPLERSRVVRSGVFITMGIVLVAAFILLSGIFA